MVLMRKWKLNENEKDTDFFYWNEREKENEANDVRKCELTEIVIWIYIEMQKINEI